MGSSEPDLVAPPRRASSPPGASRIVVDASAWPRVALRWPGGVRGDHEVGAALDALRAIAMRREAHALSIDARDARPPTPAQLGRILALARSASPRTACVATALVSRSAQVRATVDSIRWLYLTSTAWACFDEPAAADAWLGAMLERAV
jgi:hypothetical protein